MSPSTPDVTREIADPADSVLMTLARAAIARGAPDHQGSWPSLDLDDPEQRDFGDYELLEELGRGGMGVVYRARQRSLDRDVAIKFIAAGIADSINVARFLDEARAAARLMHPNIVPVHEVGSIEGVHYFSMPLVRGRTLAHLLDERSLATGDVLGLMLKLCEAIDYAHRLGLLHLDLKPANVMIDERGEPLITDFGLARHMDANGGVDSQEVSGTPAFMAPEQILIRQYRLTVATDLYGLGAIMYRCLAGVSPHGLGPPDELIRRAAAGRVRPPRELARTISADLDAVCMKCLELEPKDRYADAAALADDLRRLRDGQPVSVRPIGTFERMQRWVRREPRLAAAAAVACLALVVGTIATTWQWREAEIARLAAVAQRDAAADAERRAVAARDRAMLASELGALLLTLDEEARRSQAHRVVAWLRDRLPGDEAMQADVIGAFADSVYRLDTNEADALLFALVELGGVDYRRIVVDELLRGDDPDRFLHAARLSWNDEHGLAERPRFDSAMREALARRPDHVATLYAAVQLCADLTQPADCSARDAARRLTEVAPENAYHWVLRIAHEAPELADTLVLEAASRSTFDDHYAATYSAHLDAFVGSGVAAPVLLARTARLLAPDDPAELVVASLQSFTPPFPPLERFVDSCNPAKRTLAEEQRAACLAIGTMMARARGAQYSKLVGGAIVRRLAPGTPLADEMVETRRRYYYVAEMNSKLTPARRRSLSYRQASDDLVRYGELEMFQRQLERAGIPPLPPPGWSPANPELLLLPEHRSTAR